MIQFNESELNLAILNKTIGRSKLRSIIYLHTNVNATSIFRKIHQFKGQMVHYYHCAAPGCLPMTNLDFGPFKDVQNIATMFGQITKRSKEQYHVSVTETHEHYVNQHCIKFWSIRWGAAGVISNITSAYS